MCLMCLMCSAQAGLALFYILDITPQPKHTKRTLLNKDEKGAEAPLEDSQISKLLVFANRYAGAEQVTVAVNIIQTFHC